MNYRYRSNVVSGISAGLRFRSFVAGVALASVITPVLVILALRSL